MKTILLSTKKREIWLSKEKLLHLQDRYGLQTSPPSSPSSPLKAEKTEIDRPIIWAVKKWFFLEKTSWGTYRHICFITTSPYPFTIKIHWKKHEKGDGK